MSDDLEQDPSRACCDACADMPASTTSPYDARTGVAVKLGAFDCGAVAHGHRGGHRAGATDEAQHLTAAAPTVTTGASARRSRPWCVDHAVAGRHLSTPRPVPGRWPFRRAASFLRGDNQRALRRPRPAGWDVHGSGAADGQFVRRIRSATSAAHTSRSSTTSSGTAPLFRASVLCRRPPAASLPPSSGRAEIGSNSRVGPAHRDVPTPTEHARGWVLLPSSSTWTTARSACSPPR